MTQEQFVSRKERAEREVFVITVAQEGWLRKGALSRPGWAASLSSRHSFRVLLALNKYLDFISLIGVKARPVGLAQDPAQKPAHE